MSGMPIEEQNFADMQLFSLAERLNNATDRLSFSFVMVSKTYTDYGKSLFRDLIIKTAREECVKITQMCGNMLNTPEMFGVEDVG